MQDYKSTEVIHTLEMQNGQDSKGVTQTQISLPERGDPRNTLPKYA
jgi:hypothetical protein